MMTMNGNTVELRAAGAKMLHCLCNGSNNLMSVLETCTLTIAFPHELKYNGGGIAPLPSKGTVRPINPDENCAAAGQFCTAVSPAVS